MSKEVVGFTVNIGELKHALAKVRASVAGRSSLPILTGVAVEVTSSGVILSATDLSSFASFQVSTRSFTGEGGAVLPFKIFTDLLAALGEGVLKLTFSNDSARAEGEGVSVEVKGFSLDDFPIPPALEAGTTLNVPKGFAEALGVVSRFASKDGSRPTLTGIKLSLAHDVLTVAATDGYRLGVEEMDIDVVDKEVSFVLPATVASAMAIEPTEMRFAEDGKRIIFYGPDGYVSFQLIDARYPEYKAIVPSPSDGFSFEVETEEVLRAMGLARIFFRQGSGITHFKFGDGAMTITAQADGLGDSHCAVEGTMRGEASFEEISLNGNFVLDAASVMGDSLHLHFTGADRPLLILPEKGPKRFAVLMPMSPRS